LNSPPQLIVVSSSTLMIVQPNWIGCCLIFSKYKPGNGNASFVL
jgi:hypothetical protein